MKRRQKRFLKTMIGTELRKQIITSSKLRRALSNDNVDFIPIARKADSFIPIGIAIGDKAFDDESNHVFLREELNALSIIPTGGCGTEFLRGYLLRLNRLCHRPVQNKALSILSSLLCAISQPKSLLSAEKSASEFSLL
jgi:hypothetical protein